MKSSKNPDLLKARDEAKVALRRLAGPGERSAETVAASLRDRGITGLRRLGWTCPLARYLRQSLTRSLSVDYIMVNEKSVVLAKSAAADEDVRLLLPVWAREFIAAFDEGAFPDLVG